MNKIDAQTTIPIKSLVDSIKSTTFASTRTRQASPRCSNVRVVLFLYDEQQNPIPETIRPMLPNRMTGSWITLPTDALRIYFDLCIIKYFLNIISMTPMTMTPISDFRCHSPVPVTFRKGKEKLKVE